MARDEREFYTTLGVAPEASMAEIKRRYLAAARDAHPDRHAHDPAARAAAGERMRQLNAAWAVLGDVDARADYDRRRLRAARADAGRPTFTAGATVSAPFRPFDDSDVDDFDEADDRPITDSALPRWFTVLPALVVLGGLAFLLGGSLLRAPALVSFGIVVMVIGGVLFLVGAPVVALGRAARADRRP